MSTEDWRTSISPANAAFFLDVDGTLLGFKPRPEEVVADADLLALLKGLYTASGHALALVSGRKIADLDRIVAPLVLPAAGTHGAELRFDDSHRETASAEALGGVREAAAQFVAIHPGLILEDKGASIAIHYRGAPALQGEIAAFLDGTVTQDGLMIQHGKMVAEVKSTAHHKGTAIETLMSSPPFAGRRPVFIGDDLTDEHGFRAVNSLEGLSIKVSDGDTAAQYRLADVEDVRALLAQVLVKTEGHI